MIPSLSGLVSATMQQKLGLGQHLFHSQALMNQQLGSLPTLSLSQPDKTSANTETKLGLTGSFKHVLLQNLNQVNSTVTEPNQLMERAMRGEAVDIHDIMIANTKSELAVTMSSQMLTKAIQAYDRLNQIQV
ncbi:MAG: flagellar hook-basal body complex protein FliE [Vampirovibrionales bacterium]